jgi:hypothetical protein
MVTLSRRFSVAFLLIVALPSLVVSVVLARLYLSALYQTVAAQAEVTAQQVAQNVQTETDNFAILTAALVHAELRQLADAYATAPGKRERYLAARRLDEKLVSFFNYTKQVGAVVLFLEGGGSYSYSNYPNLRGLAAVDRHPAGRRRRGPRARVLHLVVHGQLGVGLQLQQAVRPDPRRLREPAAHREGLGPLVRSGRARQRVPGRGRQRQPVAEGRPLVGPLTRRVRIAMISR